MGDKYSRSKKLREASALAKARRTGRHLFELHNADAELALVNQEIRAGKYKDAFVQLHKTYDELTALPQRIGVEESEMTKYLEAVDKRADRIIHRIYETKNDTPDFILKEAFALRDDLRSLLRRRRSNQDYRTSRVVSLIIAIFGVLCGVYLLSPNITGNAIADLSIKSSSFLAAGLFIIAIIAGFFWLKNRK